MSAVNIPAARNGQDRRNPVLAADELPVCHSFSVCSCVKPAIRTRKPWSSLTSWKERCATRVTTLARTLSSGPANALVVNSTGYPTRQDVARPRQNLFHIPPLGTPGYPDFS